MRSLEASAKTSHEASKALLLELSNGLEVQWPSVHQPWKLAQIGLEDDGGQALLTISVEATGLLSVSNRGGPIEEFVRETECALSPNP